MAILKRTSRSASVQGGYLALEGELDEVVFFGDGSISDEDEVSDKGESWERYG